MVISRRICLAIGAADAPPLDWLPGAINGARAFAAWAASAGFTTLCLTDEQEPVTLARVSAALASLVGNAGIDRALIFFAGHGLTTPLGGECWLLSDWQTADETLSVRVLRAQLDRYGIAELAILSDACRTIAASPETVNLPAPGLLPRGTLPQPIRKLDIFRAAPETRAAYMIPGPTPAEARCIFSALLTEALSGAHAGASDPAAGPPGAITGASLATFLMREVPVRAGRYGVALQPEITPHFETAGQIWAIAPAPPPVPAAWPDPGDVGTTMGVSSQARIEPPPGGSWSNRGPQPMAAAPQQQPAPIATEAGSATFGTGEALEAEEAVEAEEAFEASEDFGEAAAEADLESQPPPDPDANFESLAVPKMRGLPQQPMNFDLPPTAAADPEADAAAATGPTLVEIIAADSAAVATRATARATAHAAQIASYAEERRPDHFETAAGLTIVGASFNKFAMPPSQLLASQVDTPFRTKAADGRDGAAAAASVEHLAEGLYRLRHPIWDDYSGARAANPYWQGADTLQQPLPLLARLQSFDWIATCAFPGFLTTHRVDDRGLISLIARKMFDAEAPSTEDAIARLATGTLADMAPLYLAGFLDQAAFPDPLLGILTAWRFDAMGDIGSIKRLAARFALADQPIPFDIALLAGLPASRQPNGLIVARLPALSEEPAHGRPHWLHAATPAATGVIAGAVPFLTAGWDLLDPDDPLAFPGFESILPHLRRSAPFTTLSPEGGPRLADLLGFVAETPSTEKEA